MPEADPRYDYAEGLESKWDKILALRSDVNKSLELARAAKTIGKPLDAEVTIYLEESGAAAFGELKDADLTKLFIVSKVTVVNGGGNGYASQDFKGAVIAVNAAGRPNAPAAGRMTTGSEKTESIPSSARGAWRQ
jgi:isoleucyl-tRNA synthetase